MQTSAVGAAGLVMFIAGAPVGRWAVHLVSAGLGCALAAGVVALPTLRPREALFIAVLGVAITFSTLAGAGMDGVTRWHAIGPVSLHVSALVAPALVVHCSRVIAARAGASDVLLVTLQLAHIAQPDAGQASAIGAAALVLSWQGAPAIRVARVIVHGGCVALAWSRPDPLLPAPFVEDIVARARAVHVGLAVVLMLALVVSGLSSLAVRSTNARLRVSAWALSAYLAGAAVAAGTGAFPFPLIGFAPSAVLGAYLGLAVLTRATRSA